MENSNKNIEELKKIDDMYTQRFASLWALKYKPIRGKPTTFISKHNPYKNRPWQIQILDDNHPNKVIEKSRQLGLSELSVTECLNFLITHDNTKLMYTFPTYKQMNDFSTTRITPVFKDSAYLGSLLSKEVNNVSTKKIGTSYLLMRSSSSASIGEGADVDCTYFDEYDRMKDNIELAFQEGLKSSRYGYIRKFSTPTLPGRGINKHYLNSDQMRYFHTCPHCGEKQHLTFDDNIIQVKDGLNLNTQEIEDGTFIVGCKKCKKELDRWKMGEWVPMYPSIKATRGYHISQLDATWISADDIMRRKLTYTSKQLFYNYVIGEPYAAEGLQITDADLIAAVRLSKWQMSRNNNYVGVVAGIDWGEPSYMVIIGLKANGAIDLMGLYSAQNDSKKPLQDVSTFCAILRAYNPNLICCDAGYGSDKNAYGYTQFPASWYSVYWTTNKGPQSRTRFMDNWNENSKEVSVDKTVRIQRVLHTFKNHLLGLPPWDEKIETLCNHLKNTRIMDMEDDGVIYKKATRVGADHYVSATAYAMIGIDKLTNYGIKFNQSTEFDFI